MLSFCKYFVKESVKYLPIFGWGMKIMGMVMLKRNWAQDRAKFHELFSLFTNGQLPVYLVSYPEGSRVTRAKLQKSQDYAREHKLPLLDNLLLPRSKGFIATMLGLRGSDVNALYDVTAVYYHRSRGLYRTWTFSEMFTGRLYGYHVHIHVDRIPFDMMPKGEDELKAWIFTRFKLKDGLVSTIGDVFRETFEVKQA
jgi:lysophosphatidic acid acyltransferase/lysophosphatidylinositol acyltransferase